MDNFDESDLGARAAAAALLGRWNRGSDEIENTDQALGISMQAPSFPSQVRFRTSCPSACVNVF